MKYVRVFSVSKVADQTRIVQAKNHARTTNVLVSKMFTYLEVVPNVAITLLYILVILIIHKV